MKHHDIQELVARLKELSYIQCSLHVLSWDQEVSMPKKGSEHRASTIAFLSGDAHRRIVALNSDGLLDRLKEESDNGVLSKNEKALVREVVRDYTHATKVPEKLVIEMAETTSRAQTLWADARRDNDVHAFLPWLKKIVAQKRTEADCLGYEGSPYNALIDLFEPDMTVDKLNPILYGLRDFLQTFVPTVTTRKKISIPGTFTIEGQRRFGRYLSEKMGFDLEAGRIDVSTHPFTSGFHPNDVRITTRYNEKEALSATSAVIHETGHALYEQGLPHDMHGTPLGEAVSLGIHESQSRLWETMLGQSKPFWKFFYPKFKKEFPALKEISLNDWYAYLNQVHPSLIRVEADEVTYNLHIILRYELEKEMIEGTVSVKDIPDAWNQKMKEYLGITVPNHRRGMLQDVHWSAGLIGYFPTYTLGNLYAATWQNSLMQDFPDMDHMMTVGNFAPIREWLARMIHRHGRLYPAEQLVERITGEPLSSSHFISYLQDKYEK